MNAPPVYLTQFPTPPHYFLIADAVTTKHWSAQHTEESRHCSLFSAPRTPRSHTCLNFVPSVRAAQRAVRTVNTGPELLAYVCGLVDRVEVAKACNVSTLLKHVADG